MRKVFGSDGSDNTAAALAWLTANREMPGLPNLYLIGEVGDPNALWLTDYPRAITWGPGTFLPSVIKRGTVSTKIGLDTSSLDITYAPANLNITQNIGTTSPIHLAQIGYYDNWRVRVWRAIMPTPGDAVTYGAYELFGGRIASATVDRQKIAWKVNSWLDVLSMQIPANVIENTNVIASYAGATPPPGFSKIPYFNVMAGSSDNVLILDFIASPGTVFNQNLFQGGWLFFEFPSTANPNETLGGVWSIVGGNKGFEGYLNQVQIYTPLPWPPTPGSDTCFISAPFPVDQTEGTIGTDNYPFPYVPSPESAV